MRRFVLLAIALSWQAAALAQPGSPILKQLRDGDPAVNLTAAELAELSDPLFQFVLRDNAQTALTLEAVEELLTAGGARERIFVVHERIADPRPNQVRRSVILFEGSLQGSLLGPNLMLSVFFSDQRFLAPNPSSATDRGSIEAWGWDNHRGRYNYYKLDRSGTPDSRFTWKFRGSSESADLLNASDRQGTCLQCHINGAPVMKELARPWVNWVSFDSVQTYLLTSASPGQWTVARSDRFRNAQGPAGAENLETDGIVPAIHQFNRRRLNRALRRNDADGAIFVDPEGFSTVVEGPRLLRPLFETTEFNIISPVRKSGLHPFGGLTTGPGADVAIPDAAFLNADLIAGNNLSVPGGLRISEAAQFSSIAAVRPAEYKQLVSDSGIRVGGIPGDADFAWVVPAPSHIDNDLVDQLLDQGILSPAFVAAVLAIDLRNPVLSDERASLLRFVPASFRFKPRPQGAAPSPHPDELTRTVIDNLTAESPAANSPAGQLLDLLKDPDPVQRLRQQITNYRAEIQQKLTNNTTRMETLRALFDDTLSRRKAVLDHPTLSHLDESGGALLPLP